jgi:transcription-repair coupling factor (superfamily II helicase)
MQDFSVSGLAARIGEEPSFRALRQRAAAVGPGSRLGPIGLPDAVRPAVLAELAGSIDSPWLWVCPQADEAGACADALRAYLPNPERVFLLPAPDALPYERVPWDPPTRGQRMATLAALARWSIAAEPGCAPIVVAPVRAVMVCTLPPEVLRREARLLRRHDHLGVTAFLRQLRDLGYETVATVTEPGQMAQRGGIVDVYPPSEHAPIRIEWFGDEIESLRRFDRASQRSQTTISELIVMPAAEALAARGPDVARRLAALDTRGLHPLAESELRRHREHLEHGERFNGIEFYIPLLHPEQTSALDHLPLDAWLSYDDLDAVLATAQGLFDQAAALRRDQEHAGELPADWMASPLIDPVALERRLGRHRQLRLGQLGAAAEEPDRLGAHFSMPPRFGGNIEAAVLATAELTAGGEAVVVVSRQAPRVAELLGEVGLHVAALTRLPAAPRAGGLAVVHGALEAGWTLAGAGPSTTVLTDGELFGWQLPHRRRQWRSAVRPRPGDHFAELTPGDYVVHIEHGIGVFRGIVRLQVGEVERDYLHVEYAQNDALYVPTHQADRVARYVGAGDSTPAISRLGTADWERAKARARRAVEDIARELLELYAQRELARRAAFAPDTAWQAEMEAGFPYLETEDQLRAIDEVKRDMESERPMDRLVVGDVGFGKTEVALRAAFKAVMTGRQVAVLAPTTVLAQQHLDTFRRRLGAFPVRIEMLSRFRSRKEQAEVIDRLATGEVDIVVGTHRLLSADVQFKRLGLLIVDEEHRFGVRHKERLRQLREGVDTLTLTATPIPRTMHMALTGLRDLTTIDTPPEERLPVVTHVGPYDDGLVRQAIRRELGRQGQVFYVFNRVQGILQAAQKVAKLVPEARVGVAHGQMGEDELAQAMLDFVGGRTDVLVCTSIIESGLDIQNANTLIVERADRFGLAQLHQLRGRVGRGALRAYAYFLHPPGRDLPIEAADRLEALAEASALGSGFRLAMRDLEIRGAGEILGARQHGQVAAIGLELYTRLLAEAIKRLRADSPTTADAVASELAAIDPGALPTVDLPLDAYLPESYVAETAERTRLYRRMAAADSLAEVAETERELQDRFGPPPEEVRSLLLVLRLRVLAHLAGAQSVGREGPVVAIRWAKDRPLRRAELKAALDARARLGRHQISLPMAGPPERWIPLVEQALAAVIRLDDAALSPTV